MSVITLPSGLRCLRTPNAFVMDLDDLSFFKKPNKKLHGLKWDRKLKHFLCYDKSLKLYKIVDPEKNPNRIITSWNKYKVQLYPDIVHDGHSLSDYIYFHKLKESITKTITWQLYQITSDKLKVKKYLNEFSDFYDNYILKTRNCNLKEHKKLSDKDLKVLDYIETVILNANREKSKR